MKMFLSVAIGRVLAATTRYFRMTRFGTWVGDGFPWTTLTINIVGSFMLGVFVALSAFVWSPSAMLRALIVISVLGGFTTFFVYSFDILLLAERGVSKWRCSICWPPSPLRFVRL